MTPSRPSAPTLATRLPGLALLGVLAGGAALLAPVVPGVGPLVLAILFGALLANTVGVPSWAGPGVVTHSRLLELGIVLLGASLSVGDALAAGPRLFALVAATVVLGLLVVEALSRFAFDLPAKTGSVLAGGASVCGVSAAAAVSGAVGADEDQLAYVAAAILLFDAGTILLFPALGHLLDLPARTFGVWAGLAMFSTGPVAAAGFAYGPVAGQWATVTKLVRNAAIGVVAAGYSLYYARRESAADEAGERSAERVGLRGVLTSFPTFLLGFVAVAAVVNAGALPPSAVAGLQRGGDWLFALAFAGLGLDVRLAAMRAAGLKPLAVLGLSLLVVGTTTLAATALLF
ncbi:YeiH family protein [Halobium salinum]|uniref:YeiH family protein n=1 Tax=Halobium salinum TaxID=1364940 RepID=A0ABD5PBS0_9EURY|nr:putative sulfate exporter family transporter [Halobium salinum]